MTRRPFDCSTFRYICRGVIPPPVYATFIWNVPGVNNVIQQVSRGGTPTSPTPVPNNPNHTFTGWSPQIRPINENTTFTAQWLHTPPQITITYLRSNFVGTLNGGTNNVSRTVNLPTGMTVANITVEQATTLVPPPSAVYPNHVVLRWWSIHQRSGNVLYIRPVLDIRNRTNQFSIGISAHQEEQINGDSIQVPSVTGGQNGSYNLLLHSGATQTGNLSLTTTNTVTTNRHSLQATSRQVVFELTSITAPNGWRSWSQIGSRITINFGPNMELFWGGDDGGTVSTSSGAYSRFAFENTVTPTNTQGLPHHNSDVTLINLSNPNVTRHNWVNFRLLFERI